MRYQSKGLRMKSNRAIRDRCLIQFRGFAGVLLACTLMITATVGAVELPWWVDSVDVTFTKPGGQGAVSLSGIWNNTCVPDAVGHSLIGNTVALEITQPGIGVACGEALTPWSLTEEFGPLDSPYFSVAGTLVAVNPEDRNQRERLAGPDRLANFPPPARAHFGGIGSLNPNAYVSAARETSANGRVVVGHNQVAPFVRALIISEAFAWTPSTQMFPLGILPGGIPGGSTALGIAGDGNTVVGVSSAAGGWERAFVWTLGNGIQSLPSVMTPVSSRAEAASWNGQVIVGSEQFSGPGGPGGLTQTNPFRWTRESGTEYLPQLYPHGDAVANDVSASGRVIVGTATPGTGWDPTIDPIRLSVNELSQAFLWTEPTGTVGLGFLPSYRDDLSAIPSILASTAEAVSADGRFVVGNNLEYLATTSQELVAHRGYIWSRESGMQDLGTLADGYTRQVDAIDVSGDGRLVVGMAVRSGPPGSLAPEQLLPVLWQRGRGLRPLTEVIHEMGAEDAIAGWDLREVNSMSADGTTIVGTGMNPQGVQEAWRLVLDWPAIAVAAGLGDLNSDGVIDAADAAILFSFWGKESAVADLTHDGIVDAADAGVVFQYWTRQVDLESALAPRTANAQSFVQFVPEPAIGAVWLLLLLGARRSRN